MLLLSTIRAVLPGGNPQRHHLSALLLLPAWPMHRNLARVVQHTWAMSADGSYGRDQHGVATPQPLTPYQSPLCKAVRFHDQGKSSRYDGGRSRLVAFPLLVQPVEFVGHRVPDAHIAHTAG